MFIKCKGDVFILKNSLTTNKYGKLLTNTVLFGLSTFSSKILVILMLPLYTRFLSTGGFSSADLIFSSANLLTPIASIGIAESIIRFGLDKSYKKSDVFSSGILVVLVGFAITLLFAPLLQLSEPIADYTKLIYLYVFMACFKSVCSQFVRARGLVRLFAVDGIVSTIFVIILNVILLVVFNMGVTGYVLSTIIADGLSVIFLAYMGSLHRFIKFKINPTVIKAMLIFSIPMIPNAVSWWITNASDRFMVQYFWGDQQNGLYAISYKIPTIISAVSILFSKAWQISAFTEKSGLERERFFSTIFKLYQMFILTAISAIIIIMRPMTSILVADAFYDSWKFVPFLLLGVGYSCFVTFLGSIYMAEKKNVMSMISTISGAVLNIILNLILIPIYGAQGAAIATCTSFVFVFLFRAFDTKRLIRVNYGSVRLLFTTAVILLQSCVSIAEYEYATAVNIVSFITILLIYGYCFMRDNAKRKSSRNRLRL